MATFEILLGLAAFCVVLALLAQRMDLPEAESLQNAEQSAMSSSS